MAGTRVFVDTLTDKPNSHHMYVWFTGDDGKIYAVDTETRQVRPAFFTADQLDRGDPITRGLKEV
jgi:hypothetical protein